MPQYLAIHLQVISELQYMKCLQVCEKTYRTKQPNTTLWLADDYDSNRGVYTYSDNDHHITIIIIIMVGRMPMGMAVTMATILMWLWWFVEFLACICY